MWARFQDSILAYNVFPADIFIKFFVVALTEGYDLDPAIFSQGWFILRLFISTVPTERDDDRISIQRVSITILISVLWRSNGWQHCLRLLGFAIGRDNLGTKKISTTETICKKAFLLMMVNADCFFFDEFEETNTNWSFLLRLRVHSSEGHYSKCGCESD